MEGGEGLFALPIREQPKKKPSREELTTESFILYKIIVVYGV